MRPEFCFALVFHDMDVDRFTRIAFVGIEEKPKSVVAKDRRHGGDLAGGGVFVTVGGLVARPEEWLYSSVHWDARFEEGMDMIP